MSLETLKIFSFFSKSSKMLYFGVKEKKMVVVCALLEHEIIMMIPAVAEPVVEFQLLKKCLRYSSPACSPRLGKITIATAAAVFYFARSR